MAGTFSKSLPLRPQRAQRGHREEAGNEEEVRSDLTAAPGRIDLSFIAFVAVLSVLSVSSVVNEPPDA